MTYLPQLHRILVEGAARLEQTELDAGVELAAPLVPGGGRLGWLRRLTRRRLFIFVGAGLLASGSAAAALVALNGSRSAPSNGGISSQTGAGGSLQVAAGSYSVTVTPDLLGGGVGWCVTERDRESAPLPIGDVRALRLELVRRRAQLEARLSGRAGSLTLGSRAALEQEVEIAIPRLLSLLSRPAAARRTPAFENSYRSLLGLAGGGASDCGVAAQRGSPIVADFGQADVLGGTNATRISTTTLVLITRPEVAAVRVSPTLTLLTRPDAQLPSGLRIAIAIQQALGKQTALAVGSGAPKVVALGAQGRPIQRAATTEQLGDQAIYWQARGAGRASRPARVTNSPPGGACEIGTSALAGAKPLYGLVVQRIRGFPEIAADADLSCASTDFTYHGQIVLAAILLNAEHPGAAPAPLPDASRVSGRPPAFSLMTAPGGHSQSITARRVGDAWLVIRSTGSLRLRLAVLAGLRTCVRTAGRCP